MPVSGEIATIKAEIERLEKALRDCADGGIRRVIEGWLSEARKRLAFSGGTPGSDCPPFSSKDTENTDRIRYARDTEGSR
jgi:hypothetical protein